MPRIIFRCPYIKGGSAESAAHLENYVGYVATREGVERIDPGRAKYPATRKQRDMVERLLREFPLSRGMFEYEDYLSTPTRGNASEFITRALEDNIDQIAKRENYLQYIAMRPRAQQMGPHGLFTGTGDSLVLSQTAEAVARHPGNVWLPIISLRREDAARLGYDNAEAWRDLLSSYALEMAKAMKIPWEQFRWYAAYHDEGHHPHVHMVCYSEDPAQGFLTRTGIAKIKSDLAKEIFRQELTALYQKQTQARDEITQEAQAIIEKLIQQMQTGSLHNERIEKLMAHLSHRLQFLSGKKQYGYLKAPLKAVVDEIVEELAKDSRVADAYRLWYELRGEVLRTYKDELPQPLPLSQQKEFKRIKNMVIEEAVRLGGMPAEQPDLETRQSEIPEEPVEPDEPSHQEEDGDPSGLPEPEEPQAPEDVPLPVEPEASAAPHVEWSDEYKQARRCLYGGDERPPDFEKAYDGFLAEARRGNALAMHDLGRMFADGLVPKSLWEDDGSGQESPAHWWYAKALGAFLAAEEEKPWRYLEYRIGKMYAAGLGTDQDHGAAAQWFSRSANQRYKYAQYSLGGLYYHGKGVEKDFPEAFRLYSESAAQDFPYASFELGKMCRDGIGTEIDPDASARHFAAAYSGFCQLEMQSHDDRLQYRIGWMLLHGIGTRKEPEAAKEYFEKSARLGNPHAQYQLAKLALSDVNADPKRIAEALEWLAKSAEAGQDCAQYALAKLYRDGKDASGKGAVEQDIDRAVELFEKAAAQENHYASYALGKLYLEGKELPKDIDAALRWLRHAAKLQNSFAQYRLGKLHLIGEEVPKDVEAAILWLTASADQGNSFAQYTLASVYLKGEDTAKDLPRALALLNLSADQGNQFAQYALAILYLKGEQIPKDLPRAWKLLTLSADQGNQFAQYQMGKLLLAGEELPKDVEAAVRWLTASADKGNQFAQYRLGKLYLLGKDVPKDKESAARWFTLAAAQGNEYAQYFLDHIDDVFTEPLALVATRLLHHLGNIFREQTPPPSGSAGMRVGVDKKLLRKIKEKKIAQGHKQDDHEPSMTL